MAKTAAKAKKVETVAATDYVALMESVIMENNREALQQFVTEYMEPIKALEDGELLDPSFTVPEEYIKADQAEKAAKALKEELRATILRKCAEVGRFRFRIDEEQHINVIKSSSSTVNTMLLTPEEQMQFETLKTKATVTVPTLAIRTYGAGAE